MQSRKDRCDGRRNGSTSRRPRSRKKNSAIVEGCWGRSSAGRASRSQCEGQEFDPPRLHHPDHSKTSSAVRGCPKSPRESTLWGFFLVRRDPGNPAGTEFILQGKRQELQNRS